MTTSRRISTVAASAALALAMTSVAFDHASPAAGAAGASTAPGTTARQATTTPQSRRQAVAGTYAYRWPVKPFDRQHPVRGFFGDPRIANDGESRQFHFGIDISAPNGTPVYATLTGHAFIHPLHDTTIAVVGGDGTEFSYWHVVPTVHTGDWAVAYRTVIGHIEAPYGHVHFSERRASRYLNPLRPGALGPFVDETTPTARSVTAQDGVLVAETYDETPLAVPRPWQDLPVMPALVRFRLQDGRGRAAIPWTTPVDFRLTIPPASEFDERWAPGTTQNHVRAPGRYRVVLSRSLGSLHSGKYVLELTVSDTRNNTSHLRFPLLVTGAQS
jgi:hypothetical protein